MTTHFRVWSDDAAAVWRFELNVPIGGAREFYAETHGVALNTVHWTWD